MNLFKNYLTMVSASLTTDRQSVEWLLSNSSIGCAKNSGNSRNFSVETEEATMNLHYDSRSVGRDVSSVGHE